MEVIFRLQFKIRLEYLVYPKHCVSNKELLQMKNELYEVLCVVGCQRTEPTGINIEWKR